MTNSAGWPAGVFSRRLATPIRPENFLTISFPFMNCVPNFAADCFFSTKIIAEKGIWEEFLHDVEDILLKKVELGILYPIRPTRFDIHRWGRQVNSKKICVT